ncbi:hypothetical protein Poli38472_011233 [Pythium oligandrum]|uniref:C2 domain-containing protein n=1 Tax=Pythium oligandrum TaxID=41045 RepID=A0A8K1CSQ2_PYTOL|nr:hypothetical protein Poli38472_011233 [Pythium oligandrum]|eukprot:TMW67613.1 hypothetical protein Poli38472_011233 [Pythium oligandrum]
MTDLFRPRTPPTSRGNSTSRKAPQARLLLRVRSAMGLPTSSHGVYCKLYLGDTPMVHGSQKKLFGGKKARAGDTQADDGDELCDDGSHRIFRTKSVTHANAGNEIVWDDHFDVAVFDPTEEILSVRVKCPHRLFSSVYGVLAIKLRQLKMGKAVNQWFPLMKNQKEVAQLRLQLVLSPVVEAQKERRKNVLQADISTALAANHAADEAIDRLIANDPWKKSREGEFMVYSDEDVLPIYIVPVVHQRQRHAPGSEAHVYSA